MAAAPSPFLALFFLLRPLAMAARPSPGPRVSPGFWFGGVSAAVSGAEVVSCDRVGCKKTGLVRPGAS